MATALSEVLQWTCSPRGGNNFYGRLLNQCVQIPAPGLGTCGVTLSKSGRYLFMYDVNWFESTAQGFRILVVIHEAGHLALRHVERMSRVLANLSPMAAQRLHPVVNVAADMCVNDVAVRPFLTDKAYGHNFGDFRSDFIWPEDREYPTGKSFEEYLDMLLEDLKGSGYDMQNVLDTDKQISQALEGDPQNQPGNAPQEQTEDSPEGSQGRGGDSSDGDPNDAPASAKQQELDEKLPEWFKSLVNGSKLKPIDITQDLSTMTSAEVERMLDRAKREGKKIIKTAIEQTERSRGTIPGGIAKALQDFLTPATIPWETVLKGQIKSVISSKLVESVCLPNTALFPVMDDGIEPYPGFQNDFTFVLSIAVDTSGSVGDDEFVRFMSEILNIPKSHKGVRIHLMMFDAAIQFETWIDTENEADVSQLKRELYRYGYGGTDFCPAFLRVCGKQDDSLWEAKIEHRIVERLPRIDLFIMFTDGYAPVSSDHGGPAPALYPNCPVIWVLTPSGKADPAMGDRTIQITE